MEGLVLSDLARDLLINIINIIVLFLIVRKLAYKPVKKFLEDRKKRVNSEWAEIAAKTTETEQSKKQYEQKLAYAKEESDILLRKAEKTARQSATEILENARKQADDIIEKAKKDAAAARAESLAAMQEEITDLAFALSEKMLTREVSDADDRRIAEAFFAELEKR